LALLKPENVIKYLETDITKDNLLDNTKEDPIQPVMAIVLGSIIKYDIETTRVGLGAVTGRYIKAVNSDDDMPKKISEDFCRYFVRVAKLAARIEDEDAILAVIRDLATFMKSCAKKKLEQVSMEAVQSIGEIGMTASEKYLEYATIGAVSHLEEVGKTALDEALKGADTASFYLGEIGITFAKKESAHVSGEWVYSARVINVITAVVKSLLTIGRIALEKQCKRTILEATRGLAKNALVSEEIAKKAIREQESKVEDQKRETFQKFKKLYEEELERLRAEQQK
jgi:hypothetical protein